MIGGSSWNVASTGRHAAQPAVEADAQLPLHEGWQAVPVRAAFAGGGEERLQFLANDLDACDDL